VGAAVAKFDDDVRAKLIDRLERPRGDVFTTAADKCTAARGHHTGLSAAQEKADLAGLFQSDLSARLGAPPYRHAVEGYVEAEVLPWPWVPGTWNSSRRCVGTSSPGRSPSCSRARSSRPSPASADLFQLHLTQLVATAVGLAAAANVTAAVHTVDGRNLCRVHVAPSGHPVTARVTTSQGPKESFFIRLNNGTRAIDDDTEVQRYVAQRWGAR
jgi:hypothetical protein